MQGLVKVYVNRKMYNEIEILNQFDLKVIRSKQHISKMYLTVLCTTKIGFRICSKDTHGSLDESRRVQANGDESQTNEDESRRVTRRVQTNLGECRRVTRRVQTIVDELDECRRVYTNVDQCKRIKAIVFDINRGFPRWMFFNLCRFFPQNYRRMNKFVLHCNRCTIVTRFFNLDFVRI